MKKLTYLLIAIIFIACKKENKVEANVDLNKIYGQWELYILDGGFAGVHQVNTLGQHVLGLEVNKGNTLQFYDNNIMDKALHGFMVVKGQGTYGPESYDIKIATLNSYLVILKAKSDTLKIADDFMDDGFTYTYIRYRGK